jgi:hypothetical protein
MHYYWLKFFLFKELIIIVLDYRENTGKIVFYAYLLWFIYNNKNNIYFFTKFCNTQIKVEKDLLSEINGWLKQRNFNFIFDTVIMNMNNFIFLLFKN